MKVVVYIKNKVIAVIIRFFMHTMNFFITMDDKMVLYLSFDGRSYSDNPKAIYETMLRDAKFDKYQLIWALKEPVIISGCKVIKRQSIAYFYYLSKSKYWVFNNKMPDYYIKRADQVYLQTWHGTPLKRLAHDMPDLGITYYRSKQTYQEMVSAYDKDSQLWDYLISPNQFSTAVFCSAFKVNREKIIETGYPRNDILTTVSTGKIQDVKEKFNIPSNKQVILYAPTWRDNAFNLQGYTFELNLDFTKWHKILGDDYVIIFKPHYLIAQHFVVPNGLSEFVLTMPATADINELYIISDQLITDYSSVFFDYAILNRPIYFYMFDFETYRDDLRGFYLQVPKALPNDICYTQDQLLTAIRSGQFDFKRLAAFNEKFNHLQDGKASKRVIDEVFI
ncbi:CDP-glycerol glycerophosphotransferase family protein [Lactococcus carnosus]|uniref:CDP-glycerol glycerophosphotransferase family protein n=4 Tax=Pseudolactococcus carnosus TaxID=2749961 RepID=UPI001FB97D65|nr:CDP-glycerol glycerophosphotransferase family protein [Lactococcus carnosus]MCJ1980434.1 CDP-glycerol glycerophosphotransferase family protein [Lactococcus carnosus]MCJ2000497.1 CDP-glycerol glycerophosphotransferase family protein [Lactococcus carnosus]